MLGWILLGIAVAAVGVVVISGIISKARIKEVMQEQNIQRALITEINSSKTKEIQGDGIDDSLREYDKIIA